MRKIIYAFGIATFLAMFIFTITTSLTNPFYGMSEAALAQASSTTSSSTTGNCNCEPNEQCIDGVCYPISDTNNGFISRTECPGGGYKYTCGGTGNNCPGDDDC